MPHRTALPKICIALGFPSVDQLLAHARQEAEAGETFLEFRLDYLPKPEQGVEAIRQFLERYPQCTILATCRRHQNHGRFNGSIEEQIRILDQAIQAGARAVDIEVESAENAVQKLETLRGRAWLIISYHNFGGTPSLDAVMRRMAKIPADAYKIVSTARKPSDNLRVLSLAKANPRVPLILLAMGEIGFPTRVLSTAFGGAYTYAAPLSAEGTAAGQVSSKLLRNLYRVEKFSKAAKIYGVIADPVRHSISPAVHNRAFQTRRIDSVYLPFLVHPPQLKDFFLFANKLPIAGFSVTIPHKQKVLRYLDQVDPMARRIGAVNTVWRKAGKWRGTNTDVQGVVAPLAKKIRLSKASVLVVGNGGAARSAAFALVDAGAKVSIVGRNPDRVRALAKVCNAEPLLRDELSSRYFDALIHATPLGMHPHVNECFFPDRIPAEIVFDMVYNPLETLLLKRAAEQRKVLIDGLQMFLEQAALQFEIWTGESAPRPAMEKAAIEMLNSMRVAPERELARS
ncbi:MAG: shikimate dehydrogenase [Bryobacteraceae bacterium]|nr:shikimate dehydrogenase [Bryobacteraceae bacterium]MDW8377030.1 shikimate dehydrogenase [Bryobacterales bacterium]